MSEFICNIAISLLAFASWYLAGLGSALILLPRGRRREAFLLAPLLGMCLLTLLGLFQITVLLTPLVPRINVGSLTLISLLLCCWVRRRDFQVAWSYFRHREIWLGLPSLMLLLAFAWMFHNGGFQMLVGGSDQLQYSSDARQILEQMHTGSALDIPVPRQDHFIYEMNTRTLPYMKNYRRGAEVMLATTTAVTGLSYEEAFPVTILCALLTLGLALGFIGRVFLRFSLFASLVLQITFLSSFYLLLLHIQGSLALLMSLAPSFMALALLSRVMRTSSWRWLLLAAIGVAVDLSIYSEAALINIVLPSALLIVWEFWRSRLHGFAAMRRMASIYLIVLVCAPFAVYSVIANAIHNFSAMLHSLVVTAAHTAAIQAASVKAVAQQWDIAAVVLGSNSYYDTSAFNANVAQFVAQAPWVGWLGFFVLCACGLLGYLKTKNRLAHLFAVVLIFWSLTSLVFAHQQDSLRFMRSLQYAIPFAMFGLVILASRSRWFYSGKCYLFWFVATWIGRLGLLVFVLMNIYTSAMTIHFIASHNVSNDPVLLRFDERGVPWQQLQDELQVSALHNTPVLLSGFRETIRPFAIAIIIRTQPQVLGTSILSFWPLYEAFKSWHSSWSDFNTRFSAKEFRVAQQQQNQPWSAVESRLIKNSVQAIVPMGNGYPIEWSAFADVYAPRIKRFANICDVVYRKEYSVSLSNDMTSRLKKDAKGPYRLLWASGFVIVHDHPSSSKQLILEYEGDANDVGLKVRDHYYMGQALKQGGLIKLAANISPGDISKLHLIVKQTVKLRSMSWIPSGTI